MRFDQISTQLAQRPAPVGLPDFAGRLLRQLHDAGHLAGGDARGRATRLQVSYRSHPRQGKGMQIGIDRVDMHALRFSNLQRAEPHAIQQHG
jgi:hypothetical protein